MSSDFPMYALSEEHQAIREAVRAVCDAKVAPYAADVDENARYPQEAADFHAPHVPEEYGGAGADALATVLVIEEVARACVSSSLIPAVNKLGSLPVQIAGDEDLKKKYLGKLAAGEGGFSYCLSEPDAGWDAVSMKTKSVRDGDHWVLNGVKRWITNAEVSEYYTVMAVTDPDKRSKGISAFVVEKSDEGVSFGAKEKKLGIQGSPTREVPPGGDLLIEVSGHASRNACLVKRVGDFGQVSNIGTDAESTETREGGVGTCNLSVNPCGDGHHF